MEENGSAYKNEKAHMQTQLTQIVRIPYYTFDMKDFPKANVSFCVLWDIFGGQMEEMSTHRRRSRRGRHFGLGLAQQLYPEFSCDVWGSLKARYLNVEAVVPF